MLRIVETKSGFLVSTRADTDSQFKKYYFSQIYELRYGYFIYTQNASTRTLILDENTPWLETGRLWYKMAYVEARFYEGADIF